MAATASSKRAHAGTSSSLLGSERLGSMAQRLGLMGDSPTKVEARKQLAGMFETAVEEAASTHSPSSGKGSPSSVPSTARGSFGGDSEHGKAGKGNGRKGRGKGGGKNKCSTKGATLADQIANMRNVSWTLCRLVCAHAQEVRRLSREHNQELAFTRPSTLPAKLSMSKETWTSEIPEKAELVPFPSHPDRSWRVAAMVAVGMEPKASMALDERSMEYAEEELKALRAAAKALTHEAALQVGLHRFWKLRDLNVKQEGEGEAEEVDGDAEAELWMMRFADNQPGQKLNQAMHLLEQQNVVDTCLRATIRADRARTAGCRGSWRGSSETSSQKGRTRPTRPEALVT